MITDEETDADTSTEGPMSFLLRQALDQSSEAVAVYTAAEWVIASTVVYANPALCKLSGYAEEHFVGHSALLLAGARPDAASLGSILPSSSTADLKATVKKTRPDGSAYQVEVHVAPIRNASGTITHYVATQRAVIVAKVASEGVLERVRDTSYGTLAAGVAYELSDHMSRCVSGLSAALIAATSAKGMTSPGTALMIEHGYEAAVAMNDTVRGLSSFIKEEAHAPGPIDVHEAIESALRLVGSVVRERALVERHYSPVPAVNASLPRVTRLFMDVLRNAGEAIPPSMPQANHIVIETHEDAGSVAVTITDTGVGIEPADLPFVCDPFFTTKPDARTRGLGLTAVRAELASLGGDLQIDSAVGRGTRVRISFKAALGAEAPPVVAVRLAEKRCRARLLSVADTPHLAREVAQPFMDGDIELTLSTWDDALERLALAEPFHLVVCDTRAVRLPEFRERLREVAPDTVPQVFDVSIHAPEESGVFPCASVDERHAAAE